MQRRRDLLALTVLALLLEQPQHPYQIERLIHQRRKEFAAGSRRSLYHAVDHLAKTGLIEPVETSREGKRPERTVYRITEEGCDEFQTWLTELLETPMAEHPVFTAAVSFLAYLPAQHVLQALQSRSVSLEGAIAGQDTAWRALQTQLHLPRLFLLELDYTQSLLQAELAWVRALIADIQAGRLAWEPESLGRLFEAHSAAVRPAGESEPLSRPGVSDLSPGYRAGTAPVQSETGEER